MVTQPSDMYPKLAEKYSIPVEQVRDIIIYFWRSGVKRSLEELINTEIYINNLGSYKIKTFKLPYIIPSAIDKAEQLDQAEFNIEYFQFLRERLLILQQMIEEKKKQKKEFRELYQKDSRDISEQKKDMGGPTEQTN